MEAKRRYFTIRDVADAAGREAETVRKHRREGRFDADSLLSVARYISAAKQTQLAQVVQDEEEE